MGLGTFAPAQSYVIGNGSSALELADIDGDGKRDLISANNTEHSVSVMRGHGDGSFAMAEAYPLTSAPVFSMW